ncbi:outer membrane lipoprotein SlyB [Actinoplanes tereljensis]|uniref:Uncharacterized protein n=1 Tax=Paractinoplanes tereljensis TaxID=571912 RepID=A0A919NM91_9ACTN|nr:hypothetical protein [Actinoplanes tereljensis]GIF20187.1 hypothetical protein Ate02nite_29170 [Actinoplanes tereljensis]
MSMAISAARANKKYQTILSESTSPEERICAGIGALAGAALGAVGGAKASILCPPAAVHVTATATTGGFGVGAAAGAGLGRWLAGK